MSLDGLCAKGMMRAVFAKGYLLSSARPVALSVVAFVSIASVIAARAATPYREATVTRTQNKVSYGSLKGDRSELRPAVVDDVVKASNFLQTETDSRAELKYEDGSLVRIGQSTIFSFEAITRTLSLSKGSMIFYVPKGSGGANIKTPSLTAAITGTIGKVSPNYIAILEGVVRLKPSGQTVSAGQFARFNSNGTVTVDYYDPAKEQDGKLMDFNGPLPNLNQRLFNRPEMWKPDISPFDSFDRANNHPGAQGIYNPDVLGPVNKPDEPVFVPPPDNTPSKPNGPPSNY